MICKMKIKIVFVEKKKSHVSGPTLFKPAMCRSQLHNYTVRWLNYNKSTKTYCCLNQMCYPGGLCTRPMILLVFSKCVLLSMSDQ